MTQATAVAEEESATVAGPRRPRVVQDLSAFADRNETIHVHNKLNTISVFTRKDNGQEEISEFAANGDPNGEDVMALPGSYLRDGRFQKQLEKGIFEIIDADNPAVIAAFQAQRAAWDAQRVAQAESDRLVEMQQPKSFSGRQCLAQEGNRQCPEYAIFAANNYRERPPLCSKHQHLSGQFIAEETGVFKDNKPEIEWVRVSQVRV